MPFFLRKPLLIMRLTAILMLTASLHAWATGRAQITLSEKKAPLEKVLEAIKKQSGYNLFFDESLVHERGKPVDISVKNVTVDEALARIFSHQPLAYELVGKIISVKEKEPEVIAMPLGVPPTDIRGRVIDSAGVPLAGATVTVKGTKELAATDSKGQFFLPQADDNAVLVVTYIGYEPKEYALRGAKSVTIVLREKPSALNETVIIGYGTTNREVSTGSVSTVSAETIHDQPVANPLMALEGQVPGMDVVQTSGRPGANISVQIRGTNSIGAGTYPLYIVDGVPYDATPMNEFDYLGDPPVGDQSPLNSINPSDIESISVLKDADATAIYGSRGSNGVVLITTKRGKNTAGKLNVSGDYYQGWGDVAHFMKLLNTPQYLALRKQAYTNDGLNYLDPSVSPPDLTVFSQTQYTDWQKELLGNTSHTTNASVRLESGSDLSRFSLGLTYRRESTVYPSDAADQRIAAHMTYDVTTPNRKFGLQLTNDYSYDVNKNVSGDPGEEILFPPNFAPYTSTGGLNFNGLNGLANPLSIMYQPFDNTTYYLSSNAVVHYKVLNNLDVKVNMGYNQLIMDQTNTYPSTSMAPVTYSDAYANFGDNKKGNWVVEPQVNYNVRLGGGVLTALGGGTLERQVTNGEYTYAYNYSSDLLLNSPAGAAGLYTSSNYADYRYASLFGRLNYDWQGKYILNGNIRRDGSSRFGPDKQYGTFMSIGGAWVFSKENFMKGTEKVLNFGKLRASYGTTGNDQIADYGYYSVYSTPYANSFQGTSALIPENLSNGNYSWETDKKLDIGLDLGFADNRLSVTADYYQNRTGNQLVGYALPALTGFTSVEYNLPAVIQNKGLELSATSVNIKSRNFTWKTTLNLTIPQNRLLKFPGLAGSSYAYAYALGQSVNVAKGYKLLKIDSAGNPDYEDVNHDGVIDNNDRVPLGNTDPKFYGGLQNSVTYKNWNLRFFIQFDKKDGYNYLQYTYQPIGAETNFDVLALQAWKTPGQQTMVPEATTSNNNWYSYASSSANFGDASFIRLKSVYLSYDLPTHALSKIGAKRLSIYVQGYNLFTITGYRGLDPETGTLFTPLIRTVTGGIQISF